MPEYNLSDPVKLWIVIYRISSELTLTLLSLYDVTCIKCNACCLIGEKINEIGSVEAMEI